METRQITEYKFYTLNLAEMHGGSDKSSGVAVFDDLEKLKAYYQNQLADVPWVDDASEDSYGQVHKWNKVFKKGSTLEWYNPLSPFLTSDGSPFTVVSFHDAAFGGVTEEWGREYQLTQEGWKIPLNPT